MGVTNSSRLNGSARKNIEIKQIKELTGASIWSYCPVLEIRIDIGRFEELPSDRLPGFADRLSGLIPSLWEHRCSMGEPGGFFERLRLGTYMGHILEHVILELQTLAGMEVGFGRTRGTGTPGEYNVVVEYKDAQAARLCTHLGLSIIQNLAVGRPLDFDLKQKVQEIREVAEDNMMGPSTRAIVDAARRRRIPWFRLDGAGGALVQLGYGCNARRIMATETSLTSSIGAMIASDKELTKDLLDKAGVPVPEGRIVGTADEAVQAQIALDGPVVLKPLDGNQGKGVSTNISSNEQVRAAFDLAQSYSEKVIVERYFSGSDYRLLVVDGNMVAAALRKPAHVAGDGLHTVEQLVEMVNDDPSRGQGHGAALTRIKLDPAAELTLARQGFTRRSVPSAGEVVFLRDNSNLSTGGTATDVTSDVHPDNAGLAVLAARVVGLDVAGIDVVCEDIGRPLSQQNGGVVEVNAAPGLRMHICPSEGKSRPVGEAIVDMLFPRDTPARVPLIAVTGTNGKTTVTRMISHVYATMKKYVGMTNTDGVYFNGVRRITGDCSGPRSAESVLQHPMVEVAVLETARGGILRSGLAWDRSNVSVVLNIAADHLGIGGINTVKELARVKRVVVESVSRDGYAVLNADDPLVVEMAEYCPGKVIFFGDDCASPAIRRQLAAGGKAVFIRNNSIVLAEGSKETVLLSTREIPATHGGLVPFQVANAMSAAAACWGAGVPVSAIKLGLRTFQADDISTPGRFNMFQVGAARVIVDYGHNAHALNAMGSAISRMQPRRKIGVVAAPGDRRNSDIEALALAAAGCFDWIIVREDDDRRGRMPGEVAQLIASIVEREYPSLPVSVIPETEEAVAQALEMSDEGDIVVIFADHVDETIAQIRRTAEAMDAARQSTGSRVPTVEARPAMFKPRSRRASKTEDARMQATIESFLEHNSPSL